MSRKEEQNHKDEKTLNPETEEQKQASQEAEPQEETSQTAEDQGTGEASEKAEETAAPAEEKAKQEDAPKSQVDKLEKEVQEVKDKHLRLFAEFENYKKRTAKERVEMMNSANQELMSALLPVVDDFQRALDNMEGEAAEGVRLIYNKLENTLKQKGLEPMESAKGKEFDLDTMEAITRIPAPEDDLKGKVVDEIEQGYYLGNKIIRYAKVVVGE